ncbi:MAG: hypothetical protein HGB02_02815 [Chlorobiaceae bacterium]|nr:hypothetical protein [Chlorobiaceae bacterium]
MANMQFPGISRWLVVLAAMLPLLGGCRKGDADRKSARRATQADSAVPDGGQSVTIETSGRTVEIMAGGVGWPAGVPAEVPPFSFGTIHSVTRTESPDGVSWSIAAGELFPEAIKKYALLLKERGFQASSMIVGNGGSVTGQKGNISIAVVSSAGNATISVALKK